MTKTEFAEKAQIQLKHLSVYAKRGKIIISDNGKIDPTHEINKLFIESQTYSDSMGQVGLSSLEKKKKSLDIEKIQEEIEILRVKKEKMHGIVIPTAMVSDLFSRHTKSLIVEFENSLDKILTQIGKKFKLTNQDISKYRGVIKEEINKAVEDAIEETKSGIHEIVDEFAEQRGRGERL